VQQFVLQKAVLMFLCSFLTVMICCLMSQCIVKVSKRYRLQLNKYYNRKRFEKAKMIQ
jgi:hypothetical protein